MKEPDPNRALTRALTIVGSCIGGGFSPLAPYILLSSATRALPVSVVFTLLALAIFG